MSDFIGNNVPFIVSLGMSVSMPVVSAIYSIKLIKRELEFITNAHAECKKERREHEKRFGETISDLQSDLAYLNGRFNGKKL